MARSIQRKPKGENRIKLAQSQAGQEKIKSKEKDQTNQSSSSVKTRLLKRHLIRRENLVAGGASKKVASLDMLAEVAAATLRRGGSNKNKQRYATRQKLVPLIVKKPPPVGDVPETTKEVMKRVSQGESLNLSQIQILSDKLLLNVFAEFTSDEIRRSYTYSCYLMPDRCKQKYNSFGNETSARLLMKGHLLGHISELLAEEKDQTKNRKKFMAEPVFVRKKRLELEQKANQKRKGASPKKPASSPSKVGRGRSKVIEITPKQTNVRSPTKPQITRKPRYLSRQDSEQLSNVDEKVKEVFSLPIIKQEPEDTYEVEQEEEEDEEMQTLEPEENVVEEPVIENQEQADGDNTIIYVVQEEVIIADSGQIIKENESVVIENLDESMLEGSSQPFHDHSYSYSTVLEETNQSSEQLIEAEEEQEQNEFEFNNEVGLDEVVIELGHDMDSSELERIATIAAQAASTPRHILQAIQSVAASNSQSDRPFQVFPTIHSKGRKKISHTIITEEELYAAVEEDPDDDKDLVPGSQDWERRMAMKYIRLLRTKKKDERIPLVCKICKNKPPFTAQATLMYHYRSHAGIKPFTCSICSASFTRQHSLNYHMLIHNNRSRFTCGDCGRKFRHPSHFKEHMRRHTGETPFECEDCCVRFKTRNTYKRHLKTRHGKLLTATGIHALSEEEFNKVRTNPKRRVSTIPIFNRQRDMETQWPEPDHIGVEEADAVGNDNLASEAYDESSNIRIELENEEDQLEDEDEATTIEVYGDPSLGQTIKVLTADGQLIDVKVVEKRPENNVDYVEMELDDNGDGNQIVGTATHVLTSEDIQGVDLQPILECINTGNMWE